MERKNIVLYQNQNTQIEKVDQILKELHEINELSEYVERRINENDKRINKRIDDVNDLEEESPYKMPTGLFKKGAAIEALQAAGIDTYKDIASIVELQRFYLELHKKQAYLSKSLLALGTNGIGAIQIVLQRLDVMLNGKDLSKSEQQELMEIYGQLKTQENVHTKLEKQKGIIKDLDEQIRSQAEKIKLTDKAIKTQDRSSKQHDEQLDDLTEMGKQYNKKLATLQKNNKLYAEQFENLAETDKLYNKKLTALSKSNKLIHEQLEVLAETDAQHEKQLKNIVKNDKLIHEQLEVLAETDAQCEKRLKSIAGSNKRNNKELTLLKKEEEDNNKIIDMLIYDFGILVTSMSKKIIIAYIIGGLGILFGLIALLVTVL